MTAYFEEPDGKVRADFALRIGRLFLDYERRVISLPADEQFDATLTVTFLQSVYAWISKRDLPAHRIGRLWKFKTDELALWVRSGGAAENEGRGKE